MSNTNTLSPQDSLKDEIRHNAQAERSFLTSSKAWGYCWGPNIGPPSEVTVVDHLMAPSARSRADKQPTYCIAPTHLKVSTGAITAQSVP